uniref:RNA-directed RNA polymerase n=1 Tax=Leviviridae sp. TaxID=2027243 RepID=A0A514D2N9_9VIRU|nr:MAG: RNA-dependent RNA polymerase [Leviviridae sp.]
MSSTKRRGSELVKLAQAFRASPSETDADIYNFLSSLDCPRSLTVWLLFKLKEHDQLTSLDCHARDFNNPYAFRDAYVATSFLSKAKFLKTSFNLKDEAMKKFSQYEELCALTNNRFRNPALDPLNNGSNVWLLNAVRRKIAEILGDFSKEEFVCRANWGPGNTTLIKGDKVSAINKFQYETGITRDLYSFVQPWFGAAYPLWNSSLSRTCGENWYTLEVGNEIVTVPKNSKTDRPIAMEPGINSWFQKSLGSMIRRRLSRSGVDLQDQSINQRLSYAGSVFRNPLFELATVDFSSASDSISTEVVRELLPPDWFQMLDLCRCKLGKFEGKLVRWNKFSSMGNGFTFELESLIFFASALAVCEYLSVSDKKVSVYGDDVIIPSSAFNLFSSFSEFLGFRVNSKKSFSSGYFRESCGAHWFDGVDCKPIYLKERIRNVEAIYKLANSVRRLAHRYGLNRSCDSRFLDTWTHLLLRIPEPLRLRVPESAGDTGLVSNFDEACPSRARYGVEGFQYRALTTTGIFGEADGDGLLLARLWGMSAGNPDGRNHQERDRTIREYALRLEKNLPDMGYGNRNPYRGRTKRSVSTSIVRQWYNFGQWI